MVMRVVSVIAVGMWIIMSNQAHAQFMSEVKPPSGCEYTFRHDVKFQLFKRKDAAIPHAPNCGKPKDIIKQSQVALEFMTALTGPMPDVAGSPYGQKQCNVVCGFVTGKAGTQGNMDIFLADPAKLFVRYRRGGLLSRNLGKWAPPQNGYREGWDTGLWMMAHLPRTKHSDGRFAACFHLNSWQSGFGYRDVEIVIKGYDCFDD